jgi:iron complex transport system substrate-binding protein
MCALGAQDRLVGRSAGCLYPPSVLEVPIVGDSSNSPNLELLLEQEPQLLLADTMIASKTELLEKIENAGIPVIIEQPGNFTRLTDFVEYLGIVLGDQENATEVVDFITYYVGLVHTRVADLSDSQKPLVYLEMSMPWRSPPQTSVRSEYLVETGGINLNANASGSTVTPEFVASANPDIIVRMISSDTHDVSDYESIWTEIMSRDQIRTTNAIKNEKVYIYDSTIFTGLRYPIGALSWAKWFHPDLFSDIDVEAVHQELNQKFYGIPIEGVYTYP